jgi:hypothetical protein
MVAAGSKVLSVPSAWTFQEFLIGYGKNQLGEEWLSANEKTPNAHPLVEHLRSGLSAARPTGRTDGERIEMSMNADLYTFIAFAYDVFTVSDNARIQTSLLDRIQHVDQFQGARYDLFAAAPLLRAGFKIEFEDEGDSTRSHCEYTATHPETEKSYSVEAKSRHRAQQFSESDETPPARMRNLIQAALKKQADHERIIFIDVNLPPDNQPLFAEEWHKDVATTLNVIEQNQRPDDPWPRAIVFFTNRKTSPWFREKNGDASTVLLTAINHPLFKIQERGPAEQAYPEIGRLFHAANNLSQPPIRFFAQS